MPSPAFVISIIALVFAVGGGFAAAKGHKDAKADKKLIKKQIAKLAPGLSVGHANTAGVADKVGPLSAAKFDYRASIGAGRTTIGTFGSLVLTGTCVNNAASPETLGEASSTVADALFKSEGITEGDTPFNNSSDDLDPGEFPDVNFQGDESNGTLTYLSPSGAVATATWGNEDNESSPFGDCQLWGTVFNG